MKRLLKLEQLVIFCAIIIAYYKLDFSWTWFFILFFSPDIMMIGYFFGNKIGAILYNTVHTYILSVLLIFVGYYFNYNILIMVGLIYTAHIAFDRSLGYGLKKYNGFKHTHLGNL